MGDNNKPQREISEILDMPEEKSFSYDLSDELNKEEYVSIPLNENKKVKEEKQNKERQ